MRWHAQIIDRAPRIQGQGVSANALLPSLSFAYYQCSGLMLFLRLPENIAIEPVYLESSERQPICRHIDARKRFSVAALAFEFPSEQLFAFEHSDSNHRKKYPNSKRTQLPSEQAPSSFSELFGSGTQSIEFGTYVSTFSHSSNSGGNSKILESIDGQPQPKPNRYHSRQDGGGEKTLRWNKSFVQQQVHLKPQGRHSKRERKICDIAELCQCCGLPAHKTR
ncbi:MAG TPA: hypothetical protein PK173_08070 [Dokdonella sp.]|jgi:hypothetical protein|nr:hypothetical protein [Dokdonella sp.]